MQFSLAPPPKRARLDPFAAQLALARVHPHLMPMVRVQDDYEAEPDATREWFELSAGRGLAGYGLVRALRILLDVLDGVTALHQTQTGVRTRFVHGELVPALLRVDDSGVTRLVPLAPWHWAKAGTLAAQERWGHLSPERLLGDPIDQRADVFSAGVLLWEALAGSRLFESESVTSIVTRLLGGKVKLPQLPAELAWATELEALAMRALSVDPAQRFATCAELSEAIQAVATLRVATHAQVLAYFAGQSRTSQHSLAAAASPSELRHHSSLSALVSAVHTPQNADAEPLVEPAAQHSTPQAQQPKRRRWLLTATVALVAALGAGVVVERYHAYPSANGSASRGAPLFNVPAAPLPKTEPALPSPTPLHALPSTTPSTALPDVSLERLDPRSPSLVGAAASSTPAAKPNPVPSKLRKNPRLTAPPLRTLEGAKASEPETQRYGI